MPGGTSSAAGTTGDRRGLVRLGLYVTVLAIGSCLATRSDWHSGPELHTLMEVVAFMTASFVALIALLGFDARREPGLLFLGAAFGATALLDGYHALVTSSLFQQSLPSAPSTLIPWSWYASRSALAVLLLIRGLRDTPGERASGALALGTGGTVAIVTATSFVFFAFVPLPSAHWIGVLGRPQELLLALVFIAALVFHLRRPGWSKRPLDRGIVLALGVDAVVQGLTMALSHELFDACFDLAHVLKIVSYAHVAWGVTAQTRVTYARAAQSDALVAAQAEIEVTNEELRSFVHAVAHDLRAPLRSLDGFSGALLEDYDALLDEEGKRYLSHIQDASREMAAMLDGLSRLSKIARAALQSEEVDLAVLAAAVIERLERESPDRRVEVELPASAPARGDPALLRVLLQNLLENAWKFTGRREGDAKISFSVTQEASGRVYTVADNGAGFEMAHQARLFAAFQRLHRGDEFSGTGMGLATAQRIVRRHGGRIWALSEPERGARFSFTLGPEQSKDEDAGVPGRR